MKTLLIAIALIASAPVFAAPIEKAPEIIKLPRIEVVAKRTHPLKTLLVMVASGTAINKNTPIIKLPRIEVVAKRTHLLKSASTIVAADTQIIRLPRIEVIGKKDCVPERVAQTAEQENMLFFKAAYPSLIVAKKINPFMPYGV
ncbi:hypothetical protein ACFQNF_17110 [Iodobacter arcticus]|uniref:Pilus formation protein N-terminal domain-containing protein n=1 Tax=Iodobacter arcticus TaxID=590593 RepID=A0ABW2R1C7_9NEIS